MSWSAFFHRVMKSCFSAPWRTVSERFDGNEVAEGGCGFWLQTVEGIQEGRAALLQQGRFGKVLS